ncbi:MAG: hypothetical protein Q8N76_07535 [Candidatus Omnitrophota bacterium]|nr:hypothetical protein [Candidatus Omnitrophota bacterium]
MADWRSYVWTYEYSTMPKGTSEIEYYLTAKVPDTDKSNVNTWQHWLELEYGITDHWDVAMYQMWKETNTTTSSTFDYDGFKVRTKYRFGEQGEFFIDPELYFEYIRDDDFSEPSVGEAKLILAKDLGRFNISYNQIIERNLEKEGKTNHEYAIGVSYSFLPDFKADVESKGSYTGRECAIGPTVSWVSSKFWVSLGVVFGLNHRTDDVQTRMIVGIPF